MNKNGKKSVREKSTTIENTTRIEIPLNKYSNVSAQEKWIQQKSININRTDCTRCRVGIVSAVCLCSSLSLRCTFEPAKKQHYTMLMIRTGVNTTVSNSLSVHDCIPLAKIEAQIEGKKAAKKKNSFVRCFLCMPLLSVSLPCMSMCHRIHL